MKNKTFNSLPLFKVMDNIPGMKHLRTIRTTKDGLKKKEDHEQPLSPMARLFHEPGSNVYIIGFMGLKTRIRPDVFKFHLLDTFLKNDRFSSLQVMDKENGSMKWVPTRVDIDEHVIMPELDHNMESSDKFVDDYISNLTTVPIEKSKPMWDVHILDVKTSDAQTTCVFRFHHSLGDGTSMMNLLLACSRKTSDPLALPTLPMKRMSDRSKFSLLSMFTVLWNSFFSLIMFVLTTLFVKDTETPLKGTIGVEHRRRSFVLRSVSLDDIKLVKKAMNATLNDVVLGVAQAGLSRYLHRRYGQRENDKNNVLDKIRLRATFFFNLRATTRIDAFVDTIKNGSRSGSWGNKIGYVLLPFSIGLKEDPLDYVREAKAVMERKKASLEPLFTHLFVNVVLKFFGIKAVGELNHQVFSNTTLWFSNVPGPQEEISFWGHEVAYVAPSCYGQPNALMIHVVSYVDKVTFVLSVDEETVPDPHNLSDDLQESLLLIKSSVLAADHCAN